MHADNHTDLERGRKRKIQMTQELLKAYGEAMERFLRTQHRGQREAILLRLMSGSKRRGVRLL